MAATQICLHECIRWYLIMAAADSMDSPWICEVVCVPTYVTHKSCLPGKF